MKRTQLAKTEFLSHTRPCTGCWRQSLGVNITNRRQRGRILSQALKLDSARGEVRSARKVQGRLLGGGDTQAEFSEMCKYAPDGPGIPGRGNSVRTRQGPVEHIQGGAAREQGWSGYWGAVKRFHRGPIGKASSAF